MVSGDSSAKLLPRPTASDPLGRAADSTATPTGPAAGSSATGGWRCVATVARGSPSTGGGCWQGGKSHAGMWEEMGEHRHMVPGGQMGPGTAAEERIGDDSAHPFPVRVRVPAKAVANLTRGEWACS